MMPLLQRAPTGHSAQEAADRPDVVVIAVRGEVDSCTSPLLRDRLLEHVRPACSQLVVDLTGVSFFGAAGLTVLVTVREAADAAGVRLCLVADTRVVLRPIMITGLDEVIDIWPDVDHAQLRPGGVAVWIVDVSLDDDGLRTGCAGSGAPSTPIA
ncbi:anti-anti-sigma factor [Lentzea aerocolonigenes]|nr:anti-anti-sigma factor [Lentzea aerocolonigenes]